jgi:hypothetical protein
MFKFYKALATILLVLISNAAFGDERPEVEVECQATEQKLEFKCIFNVKGRKLGEAFSDAVFEVNVDMPSMPLVHNVRPIKPKAMAEPGFYHGLLKLEMLGDWVLKITFSKPVRDVVIKKLSFGGYEAHSHQHMDHSSDITPSSEKKHENHGK